MMDPIAAAALVNKAAVEELEKLNLPIETHRLVVSLIAQWWALGVKDADERICGQVG